MHAPRDLVIRLDRPAPRETRLPEKRTVIDHNAGIQCDQLIGLRLSKWIDFGKRRVVGTEKARKARGGYR